MSTLTVELGERSYPIQIEAGLLSQPGLFSAYIKGPLAVIVTNETVAPLYLETTKAASLINSISSLVLGMIMMHN